MKDIYFELKKQEYSLEEKYKNLLDVVNDLKKRVKSLEIQNQFGMMSTSHGNIQPENMMGMNQPPMINQFSPNPQSSAPSKYMCIDFLFKDVIIGVQGKNDMTIEKLIKNFRVKLCNDNIKIEKYLIHPTRVELDPTSTETLASKGITEETKIIAVSK